MAGIQVLIAILAAYIAMSAWSVTYNFKRPMLMPFLIFRLMCGLGKRVPLIDLKADVDGLAKMQFADDKFRSWFDQVVNSGHITHLQLYSFNQQRVTEIDAELRRRGIKRE